MFGEGGSSLDVEAPFGGSGSPSANRWMLTALLLVLLLETALFTWTFSAFFGSDSIFFFARRLTNPTEILGAFTSLDDRGNYRPLTLVFFSFVLYPLFKLNHVGYHVVPLLFHFANTVLAFYLLLKLLRRPLAVLVGTVYFGLSSINFFITYSITFMPDFTYAFFYLTSLAFFLRFDETRKKGWLILSLAAFLLSLFCKEAAVTLPPVLLICIALCVIQRHRMGQIGTWKKNSAALAPYVVILVVYLGFFASLKGGALYSRSLEDPYRASFTLSTLSGKSQYLWWAVNLPSGRGQLKGHPRAMRFLSKLVPPRLLPYVGEASNLYVRPTRLLRLLLVTPLVVVFLFGLKVLWRREPIIIGGLLWFIIALSPVLFLATKTMRHNLYIPLVGLAAVVGVAVREVYARAGKRHPQVARAGLAYLFAALIAADAFAVKSHLDYSWPAKASLVAENYLNDLKKAHPVLPRHATLFFPANNVDDLVFYFEGGNLFRIFYHDQTFRCLFAQRGDVLPADYLSDPSTFILYCYDTHLYDITQQYRDSALDGTSHRLLDNFTPDSVSFNENEVYPLRGYFGTPGNKSALLYRFAVGDECREALVTVAGARVRFTTPMITARSKLVFGVAMLHNLGDGATGSIWSEHHRTRQLLYQRFLNPAAKPEDRRWFDQQVDLSAYAGKQITLCFECSSGESGDTAADWFGWSIMKISDK